MVKSKYIYLYMCMYVLGIVDHPPKYQSSNKWAERRTCAIHRRSEKNALMLITIYCTHLRQHHPGGGGFRILHRVTGSGKSFQTTSQGVGNFYEIQNLILVEGILAIRELKNILRLHKRINTVPTLQYVIHI